MKSHRLGGAALAAAIVASGAFGAGEAFAQALAKTQAAWQSAPSDKDSAISDKAWTGFATLGYHLDPHWRLELQGGYRDGGPETDKALDPVGGDHAIDRALGPVGLCDSLWMAPSCAQPDGSGQIYTYSGKLIFDFAPDNRWFDPFIGAATRFAPDTNPQLEVLGFGPGNTPFAYQALAGIAFHPIGRVHIDITYRWTGASGLSMRTTPLPGLAGQYQDQTVAIGLRYLFAAPPSAPAPIAYAPATTLTSATK
jgi:opacity protein-like surface antigen